MFYGLGAQAQAEFPPDDIPTDEQARAAIHELFADVIDPSLTAQLRLLKQADPMLRLALKVERPRIARQYEILWKRAQEREEEEDNE